jgi:hypothetical protein
VESTKHKTRDTAVQGVYVCVCEREERERREREEREKREREERERERRERERRERERRERGETEERQREERQRRDEMTSEEKEINVCIMEVLFCRYSIDYEEEIQTISVSLLFVYLRY